MFRSVGERTKLKNQRQAARRRYHTTAANDVAPILRMRLTEQAQVAHQAPELPQSKVRAESRRAPFQVDVILLATLVTLIIFGLVVLYSASYDYSRIFYDGDPFAMFQRQLIWLGIGLAALLFLAWFDYHRWGELALPALGIAILALILVLLIGEEVNGAKRTLFGKSVQPSEMTKLVMIIYLSVWLHNRRDHLDKVSFGLIPLGVILGVVGGLIAWEPDWSGVATILLLGGLLFFLGGGDWRQISALVVIGVLIGTMMITMTSTGKSRLGSFLKGFEDPLQGSDQVFFAYGAFARGGWLGVGIGNAETKVAGLPVPPTDSIFAVVGEETGVLGALVVIGLYLVLVWRGTLIAQRAPDRMGALLAGGVTFWIALEGFLNMAVMMNLLPFTGNALPFFSSGGSNLVTSLAGLGIVLNVSRQCERKAKEVPGGRTPAVVDLRRRDGRGRVPGYGGASGAAGTRTSPAERA